MAGGAFSTATYNGIFQSHVYSGTDAHQSVCSTLTDISNYHYIVSTNTGPCLTAGFSWGYTT